MIETVESTIWGDFGLFGGHFGLYGGHFGLYGGDFAGILGKVC